MHLLTLMVACCTPPIRQFKETTEGIVLLDVRREWRKVIVVWNRILNFFMSRLFHNFDSFFVFYIDFLIFQKWLIIEKLKLPILILNINMKLIVYHNTLIVPLVHKIEVQVHIENLNGFESTFNLLPLKSHRLNVRFVIQRFYKPFSFTLISKLLTLFRLTRSRCVF